MYLYLVQHGKAKSKDEDPERPLNEEGVMETEKMARYAKEHLGIKVVKIVHSMKLRSKMTAEIFKKHLGDNIKLVESDKINPPSNPILIYEELEGERDDIMIVGHLPHLSKLASLLLVGDPEKEIIKFKYSGILCLHKLFDEWKIVYYIIPNNLP